MVLLWKLMNTWQLYDGVAMTTQPTPAYVCVCVGWALFYFFLALWVVHDMLSSARHYGSREMERSWLQGLPQPLQIKDFPQPGRALNLSKTKEPDLSKQVLRLLSCHCSYYQSGRIYWLWCPALAGLVFTTGPNDAAGARSLFISQISLKLIDRILFASWS